ncbi:retrotransposon protein, putative, ty1-copia subclass [Tanacetum coccineum]
MSLSWPKPLKPPLPHPISPTKESWKEIRAYMEFLDARELFSVIQKLDPWLKDLDGDDMKRRSLLVEHLIKTINYHDDDLAAEHMARVGIGFYDESVLRMTNTQTPPNATTVVIPTGAPATNTVANHPKRPKKFNETVPQVEPPAEGQSSNAQAVEAWKHSEFLCHNLFLEWFDDPFINVYQQTKTPKDYGVIERKYKIKDACTKTTAILQGKGKDKMKNDKKGKGKSVYLAPKAGIVKQKFQGTCYNYDQPGHRAANCNLSKRVNPRQENMVYENVDMIVMVSDVCAMISKYCYVYCLKSKDEAIEKFVLYKTKVKNQLGKKIKVVRSDRGGEYMAPFAKLYAKHGIRHKFTASYSPQQKIIAK